MREPIEKEVRVFDEFTLSECSIVDVPANQGALLAIRKSKDGDQLSDRIKDPDLDPKEKKILAAKLRGEKNIGKGLYQKKLNLGRYYREGCLLYTSPSPRD